MTDTSNIHSPTSPTAEPFVEIKKPENWSDPESDDFDFGMQEKEEKVDSAKPDEPENEWARFQAMTSGVDAILKQKKDELDTIKVSSYYQRKKTQDEIEEDAKQARPKTLVGKRKKKWVNLDEEGFEEKEGVIGEDLSDGEYSEESEEHEQEKLDDEEDIPSPKFLETPVEEEPKVEEEEEVQKEEEVPEEDNEDDIFNTEFVDETLAVLDLKLAEIPDSPIDEGPDVFDTNYATDIVEKAEKERLKAEKMQSDKIKFGCIAAAADVLSGKTAGVDKLSADPTVRKRRRPNRNNIPGDLSATTEEIDASNSAQNESIMEVQKTVDEESITETEVAEESLEIETKEDAPVNDGEATEVADEADMKDELTNEKEEEEEEEEDDPFDAAFDELAKESLAKVNIDDLTAELYNEDLFDTSAADAVLNLASLTNVVNKEEEKEEIVLDTFDDKDPFDTSAYDHITREFEDDLDFDSLAKRDPNETPNNNGLDDMGRY